MSKRIIRVGSRDSKLAVMQTQLVIDAIAKQHPEIEFELVTMKTTGDLILNKTLDKIGGKGLFVKELDIALAQGRIDCSIHSLKDMPMEENPDLPIVALPKRGDPRDVLVLPKTQSFCHVTAQIGSSSFRRQLQLSKLFPQSTCAPVRGNVITRLQKLDCGEFSSLVLAGAGLQRVGLANRISRYFSTDEMIPAAGQGILAIQSRADEDMSFLSCIHDIESQYASLAERSFVRTLNGGCSSPIAAYAKISGNELHLTGLYAEEHATDYLVDTITGSVEQAVQLGEKLAHNMKGRFAYECR